MASVYAIKDEVTGLYLTKQATFQPLTTTTRSFQKRLKAQEVIQKDTTLFWVAVNELYKIKKERIAIDGWEFKEFLQVKRMTTKLVVVNVLLEEKEN